MGTLSECLVAHPTEMSWAPQSQIAKRPSIGNSPNGYYGNAGRPAIRGNDDSVVEENDFDAVVLGASDRRFVVRDGIVAPDAADQEAPRLDAARNQRRVHGLGARGREGQQFTWFSFAVGVANDLHRIGRVFVDEGRHAVHDPFAPGRDAGLLLGEYILQRN